MLRLLPLHTMLPRTKRHIGQFLPHTSILRRELHGSYVARQEPRVNAVGIQYLSADLHRKVFPKTSPLDYTQNNLALLEMSKAHLKHFDLWGKKTQRQEPISIPNFPELVGKNSLDEHFSRLGARYSEPYLSMAHLFFAQKLPPMPAAWRMDSGWTRYAPGEPPCAVDLPLEDELVFDVEVLYKVSQYPLMATAVSSQAWYGWVSPVLTHAPQQPEDWHHLIPFDTHKRPKLLVGYNVNYDRARVKEEYHVKRSKAFFFDAMALHIALSGFCSQQRPLWNKHRKNKSRIEEEDDLDLDAPELAASDLSALDVAQELMDDPWLNQGSPNSLASAAEFHCGIIMDKGLRNHFSGTDLSDIVENFQDLMRYCAIDVDITYKVSRKLLPEFLKRNPHPVSFAALRPMNSLFLPTTTEWDNYIESAEAVYDANRRKVGLILLERAEELVKYVTENDESLKPDFENDPWLKQMDWTLKIPRLKTDGTPMKKQAFLTGYPEWYRGLSKSVKTDDGEVQRELNLSVRTRITPLLLRLKWEGFPLIWTESAGWCFKVPNEDEIVDRLLAKNYTKAKLSEEEFEQFLPELRDAGNFYELFKIPHPEGPKKRCTSVMSKSYLRYFESGILTSAYDYAAEILSLNAAASYWMGNRARIQDQFVVYADETAESNKFFDTKKEVKANKDMGMVLPKLCAMGTVTRRATENTWLTASNSKSNRIGSELKAMIRAPKGYSFVGADVDSEELWIASLIGDSMFKLHGGTALGWMTLEGDKSEKTDLHSKTAEILGILRSEAKVFNYGRIYGAGVKFATLLLKQCNASLSDDEAAEIAKKLYMLTKGTVTYSKLFGKKVYHGGTESVMFNALESIAHQENPKTPVLGASITDALIERNLNKNSYLTSRVNWTIQSSGVDYLHLLIVSMEYLIEKFKIDARLMITVHDELRYMVKEEDNLACAFLLQISNLWTRAMFCEQMGIMELPQSCAFFSEVDVDFVLRKEVSTDCVTPSHPQAIGPGESYSMKRLLQEFDVNGFLEGKASSLQNLRTTDFSKRKPLLEELDPETNEDLKIIKLALQNSVTKAEWTKNVSAYMRQQRLVKALAKPIKAATVRPAAQKSTNTLRKSMLPRTSKKASTPTVMVVKASPKKPENKMSAKSSSRKSSGEAKEYASKRASPPKSSQSHSPADDNSGSYSLGMKADDLLRLEIETAAPVPEYRAAKKASYKGQASKVFSGGGYHTRIIPAVSSRNASGLKGWYNAASSGSRMHYHTASRLKPQTLELSSVQDSLRRSDFEDIRFVPTMPNGVEFVALNIGQDRPEGLNIPHTLIHFTQHAATDQRDDNFERRRWRGGLWPRGRRRPRLSTLL